MAEEVEIRIQKLRYSGKNYALTKALDCLGVRRCVFSFFLNTYCEASSPRCCQWFFSPHSGEPGAVCESKTVLCSSTALLLLVRRVYSSCGWATETYPSQSERSSFLGFRTPLIHLLASVWIGLEFLHFPSSLSRFWKQNLLQNHWLHLSFTLVPDSMTSSVLGHAGTFIPNEKYLSSFFSL